MKKLLLSLLMLFAVIFSTAGNIEQVYTFSYPSVSINGDFQTLNFNNTLLTGLPGEPQLPYRQVSLILPPGEAATGMEIIRSNPVTLPGTFKLAPQQQVRPVSLGPSGQYLYNEKIYGSDQSYPATSGGKMITAYLNGHSLALSTFTPVEYIPSTGKVTFYATVRIVIHTASSSEAVSALSNLRQNPVVNNELDRFTDNPEAAGQYVTDAPATGDNYEVLIITPASFVVGFDQLRAAYLEEGLRSTVTTTESIAGSMTGMDLQEKIRSYIIQEYQNHGIQHVILGGDDELIPNRGFYCHVQSSSVYEDYGIPADLYYSALDGNWNTDGDEMWAEPGEDDLLPDISVGRLSFSNLSELSKMIHKTYLYQFSPVPGEFQKVLLAGENLYSNPETWGSDYLELLIGQRDDNGYLTNGIPAAYPIDKMYDENGDWSGTDLINQLNQGYPMLNHSGHANETYVMKLTNWDITDENFYLVNGTNHNYTIVYTHGCLCGSFDYNDCIAEKMVSISHFAAAFIGNSRYGWFNEGQTEGPSAHLHREFMDALYTDKLNRIGRAHMESKIATAPWVTAPGQWEPGALRWCFYDCNLLGDPVMAMWTDNAMDITTVYPEQLQVGATGISVNVSSNSTGVHDLTCAFLMNGQLLGKANTDEGGNADIVFDVPVQSAGAAELVVSGYNCLPTAYPVTVDQTIGMPEANDGAFRLSITPNPVGDQLVLTYTLDGHSDLTVSCVTGDGKIFMLQPSCSREQGDHKETLDASRLPSGYYQCVFRSGNKVARVPFIKN